jgi:hypothetical protein
MLPRLSTLPPLCVAVLATLGCGRSRGAGSPDGATDAPGSGGSGGGCATQAAVAPIVMRACATSGCHDAVTHEHGMDLSTAHSIHASWVGKLGIDHCALDAVPRVVPGDPAASFVMTKIRGLTTCDQSQRMPPPPASMLTDCEIETIRAWIQAGAPPPPGVDGGADAAAPDAAVDADDPEVPDDDPLLCTSMRPCDPIVEVCIEVGGSPPPGVMSCDTRWECYTHFDDDDGTLKHPCPPEMAEFCGCDGVTFERPYACPDRPYQHIGACSDGVSCDAQRVRCSDPKPACPDGQMPAVVDACWGTCVPVSTCRCEFHWQCDTSKYRCRGLPEFRCGPIPPDGGADAITSAALDP